MDKIIYHLTLWVICNSCPVLKNLTFVVPYFYNTCKDKEEDKNSCLTKFQVNENSYNGVYTSIYIFTKSKKN